MAMARQWKFHALRRHYVIFRLTAEERGSLNRALADRTSWMEAALYARWERRRQRAAEAGSRLIPRA